MGMDRQAAIAWLRSKGRNARARDWALGETISIAFGDPGDGGIGDLSRGGLLYLYATADGGWGLVEAGVSAHEVTYADLESAVREIHAYIEEKELELRKR